MFLEGSNNLPVIIVSVVIGGALGLFLYSKYKKLKFSTLVDIAAPCLAIGQAFGRWGNFMNQEAFGNPVTDKALQWFPYAVYFNDPKGDFSAGWFQATFFYESMWCLLICIAIILYRNRQRFSGELALWYFALYGVERCFVELLRQDQLILGNTGIPVSSLLSGLLIVASAVLLILGYLGYKKGKLAPATPGSIYYVEPITENVDAQEAEAEPATSEEASETEEEAVVTDETVATEESVDSNTTSNNDEPDEATETPQASEEDDI